MPDNRNLSTNHEDWFLFHFSSVKVLRPDELVAALMGQGVLRSTESGSWERLEKGLPSEAHINRLHVHEQALYACTNHGLYSLQGNDEWKETRLAIGCYQYRQLGNLALAATQYGLWSSVGGHWTKTAYASSIVYDFLYLPQFIILAMDHGLALYDRLTDAWQEYDWGVAVTSLAIYHGHVLAVTEKGQLMMGNKRGGFDSIRFGKQFIFSVVSKAGGVFLCTDRGLYRMSVLRAGQPTLISVKLGCPVTDIDMDGDNLYMATLFQGVQTMT
ncbi:hypothetical protein IDH44_21920 [Paenibacillus sp. IB182496]|uniref:Uncharacterized protein n=1 Tax=Paenibacillus sabuli TaxID=2772509 RepID=A0A927GU09_9BACL|nr:hypothetical protein [Paenibacillus sabuli]MBD2847861.1 hypothetical protein [Paenibacillus sabuli]